MDLQQPLHGAPGLPIVKIDIAKEKPTESVLIDPEIGPHHRVSSGDEAADHAVVIEQAGQRIGIPCLRIPILQCQMGSDQHFAGDGSEPVAGHQVDHRIDKRRGERFATKERIRGKFGMAFPTNPKRPQALDEMLGALGRRRHVVAGAKTDEVGVLLSRCLDTLSRYDRQV